MCTLGKMYRKGLIFVLLLILPGEGKRFGFGGNRGTSASRGSGNRQVRFIFGAVLPLSLESAAKYWLKNLLSADFGNINFLLAALRKRLALRSL